MVQDRILYLHRKVNRVSFRHSSAFLRGENFLGWIELHGARWRKKQTKTHFSPYPQLEVRFSPSIGYDEWWFILSFLLATWAQLWAFMASKKMPLQITQLTTHHSTILPASLSILLKKDVNMPQKIFGVNRKDRWNGEAKLHTLTA